MTSQHNRVKNRQTYSRDFCLKLKDSCQQLPADLHADALSDLSESAFFDRGHRPGSLQYERQRQHSALIAPTLPLGPSFGEVSGGMGRGRGKFGPPPGGAVPSMGTGSGSGSGTGVGGSRFFDTTSSSGPTQQQSAFASSSPSRHTFLQPRRTSFAEDRWDSRKIAATPGSSPGKGGGTHSALVHQDGPGRAQSVPGSIATSKEGRWGKGGAADEGDWRSKKATPRYDWAENSKQGSLQSHQNGQSGGLQSRGKGSSPAPEWADEDATSRMSVTAQEIEAERQRLQAQWRKAGGTANSAAEASMQELIDDDEIERWKREAEEQEAGQKQAQKQAQKQGQVQGEKVASRQETLLGQALEPQGVQASMGQPVDLNSLFGKGIQLQSQSPEPPLSTPAASQRIDEPEKEQLQSKFEALFSLQNNRPPPVSNFPPHFPPPPPPPQDGQDAGKLLLEMLQKSGGASAGVSRPPAGPQGPLLPPVPHVPPPGFVAGPNASMGSLPYPHPHPMMPPIHPQRPPPAPAGHFPPLPVSQYPPEYPKYLQGGFPVPNNIGLQQQSGAGPVPVPLGGVPPLSMQYMPPQFQMQPGPSQGGGQFVPGMQHHLPQHLPQQQPSHQQQQQQQQQSQLLAQLFAGAGMPQAPTSQQQQYTPQQLAQLEALRVRAGGPPSSMGMGIGMGVGLPDPNQNSQHQPTPLHYMQTLGMRPPPPQQQQQQQ